jgi:hypothetical protein
VGEWVGGLGGHVFLLRLPQIDDTHRKYKKNCLQPVAKSIFSVLSSPYSPLSVSDRVI